MLVEIIGCTSAGKTTLARKMVHQGVQQGLDVILGDDLVLQKLRLPWVKNEFLRRRIFEIFSTYTCLMHWSKYSTFCRFVFNAAMLSPGSFFYRINLFRNAIRKIGIHEAIRNSGWESKIVLVDNDGMIQTAHNLFVHNNGELNGNLSGFVESAPSPDLIAYLQQPESILFERTLRRGHPRMRVRSQDIVRNFVRQAVMIFEELKEIPQIAARLLVINGKEPTLVKSNHTSGLPFGQVLSLLQVGKPGVDSRQMEAAVPEFQPETLCLDLIARMAELLEANGVRYCHWKSNIKIDESLDGQEDLDFFVGQESLGRCLSVLSDLRFRKARVKYGPEPAGVTHYYGFDSISGKLVHVHLFSRLVTGESFVKSHHLPFGEMLLQNTERVGRLPVLSRSAELVVFIIRTFIKYGSLPDLARLFRNLGGLNKELQFLIDGGDLSHSLCLLNEYFPVVDEPLFLKCVDAIDKNQSVLRRINLARQMRKRIHDYKEHGFLQRYSVYAQVIFAKLLRHLKGDRKNKNLVSGGRIIAFIGADATGKSTLVAATSRWLGGPFIVKVIHTGKPASSWLTLPVNIALGLVRKFMRLKHSANSGKSESDSYAPRRGYTGLSSLPYAVRSVTLAWDRQRLVRKARRMAGRGAIIVCDRYPSTIVGAMDSPRLQQVSDRNGPVVAVYNLLAKLEKNLYDRIPAPDVALKLRVSIETARKRNRERNEQDGDSYLEARHRQSHDWAMPGTKNIHEIDTELSIEDTILALKEVIWNTL